MDGLFSQRPFRRRRMVFMVICAILIHASIVGVAAIWPANKTWKIDDNITELDTGPVLGEPVQELVLPKDEPAPTPEATPEPTPPPDETPPDETPPPPDEPDFSEPQQTPPPPKKVAPKTAKPSTSPPPGAKHGDHPQEGVVGGVTKADKTTGVNGASRLGPAGGWRTPKPPYPYQARASHISGSGSVRVSTDASGAVVSATIQQSVGSAILDSNTTSFAKANWHGPPNASTTVPITYQLQ